MVIVSNTAPTSLQEQAARSRECTWQPRAPSPRNCNSWSFRNSSPNTGVQSPSDGTEKGKGSPTFILRGQKGRSCSLSPAVKKPGSGLGPWGQQLQTSSPAWRWVGMGAHCLPAMFPFLEWLAVPTSQCCQHCHSRPCCQGFILSQA